MGINSFSFENVQRWLKWNQLEEALRFHKVACSRLSEGDGDLKEVLVATGDQNEMLGWIFACLSADHRVWVANPKWKQAEWTQVASCVNPDVIIGAPVPEFRGNPKVETDSCLTESGLMIPTGGSSGRIKFAWHDLTTMGAAVEGMASYFLGREDVRRGDFAYYCDLPLWHVSGWMQVFRAFISDSSFTWDHADVLKRQKVSEQREIWWYSLVSTQLHRLIQNGEVHFLRSFDHLVLGGGAIRESIIHSALAYELQMYATYGLSETAGMIAAKRIQAEDDFAKGAEIFSHVTLRIAKEAKNLNEGEVLITSKACCKGYNGRRFASRDWELCSGDIGMLDDEGKLHILGRSDRMIVTGGEKVNPLEVMDVLRKHPSISDCWVFGLEHETWGEVVSAVYVLDGKCSSFDEKEIQEFLSSKLGSYKIPKRWQRVERIPYDEKGKLVKQALTDVIAQMKK